MLLDRYEQDALLFNSNFSEPASEAGMAAYRGELETRVGRQVSRSSAYITLERLVNKGYLEARMAEATSGRGGRGRRYFSLTAQGRAALRESGRALMRMWAGHEGLLEEP